MPTLIGVQSDFKHSCNKDLIFPANSIFFSAFNYIICIQLHTIIIYIIYLAFNDYLYFRDDFTIFSGGMPRASYGDKHTVTVMCGDKHQVLDFTSKVVDFFTICHGDEESGKHS